MWRKEWKREEEIVSNRWEDLGGITTAHYPSQLLISCFSFSPFLHVFCGWRAREGATHHWSQRRELCQNGFNPFNRSI